MTPRYIKLTDDLLQKAIDACNPKTVSAIRVRCVLERAPTADVVEVVRCKDCKHYKRYDKPVEDFDGKCIVRECETDENEFCSYGDKK